MQEISKIFETFGFSVALCVVLIYFFYLLIKKELAQKDEALKQVIASGERFSNYLQNNNERLVSIIQENTKAFVSLIEVLKEIKDLLKK